jgi:hypothetical protein
MGSVDGHLLGFAGSPQPTDNLFQLAGNGCSAGIWREFAGFEAKAAAVLLDSLAISPEKCYRFSGLSKAFLL